MKKALGMIETIGFVPMLEATDTACKAAHVVFLHWEPAGSGMVTAFFEGEVAAVKAAVDAGAEAAAKLGKVVAAQVIPNPYEDLEAFTGKPKPRTA
jgi:ethanolamine utilization protein EutM